MSAYIDLVEMPFVLLDANGVVKYRNAAFEREFPNREFIFDLVDSAEQEFIRQVFDDCVKSCEDIQKYTLPMYNNNGELGYWELVFKNRLQAPELQAIVLNLFDVNERMIFEKKYLESLKKNTRLLLQSRNLVLELDKSGVIKKINQNIQILLDSTQSEALGRSIFEIFQSNDSEFFRRSIFDRVIQEQHAVQNEFMFFEGKFERYIFINAAPLFDDEREVSGVFMIAQDIKEKVTIGAAKKLAEKNFTQVFEFFPNGMAIMSIEAEFLQVNTKLKELLCLTEHEFFNLHLEDLLVFEEDIEKLQSSLERIKSQQLKYFQTELIIYNKEKEKVHANLSFTNIKFDNTPFLVVVFNDLSILKNAKIAMYETERNYNSLVNNLNLVILRVDEQHNITFINPAWYTITQFKLSETLEKCFFDFVHEDDLGQLSLLFQFLKEDKLLEKLDLRIIDKNGEVHWFQAKIRNVLKKDIFSKVFELTMLDITKQKSFENELLEQNKAMEAIFRALPDVYFRFDIQGKCLGSKIGATYDFLKISGSPGGYFIDELFPKKLARLIFDSIAKVIDHKRLVTFEYEYFTEHSLTQVYEIRMSHLSESQVITVFRDITEKKLMERDLEKSERLYKLLVRNLPNVGLILVNDDRSIVLAESGYLFRNKFATVVDNFSQENALRQLNPYQQIMFFSGIDKAFQNETSTKEMDFKDSTLQIQFVPVYDKEKTVNNVLLVFYDITELKIAQQELTYESRLRHLIAAISTKFIDNIYVDLAKEVQDTLKSIAKFLHIERAYFFNVNMDLQLVFNFHQWNNNQIQEIYVGQKFIAISPYSPLIRIFEKQEFFVVNNRKISWQRKYLDEHQANSSLILPIYQYNNLIGILGFDSKDSARVWKTEHVESFEIIADVISSSFVRQAFENQNLELIQNLEKANQELESFAYIVSHDLKAPLRSIASLAQLLLMDYADKIGDEGKQHLDLLMSRVERAHSLIEGILEYSRIGRKKGKHRDIDINLLIDEVLISIEVPENIEIQVSENLPEIHADDTQMIQVFQNLISNSIKFMDKPKGFIKISAKEKISDFVFSVEDNGPGIEPQYHGKIFKIFQVLHNKKEVDSTGVGLSIVKKIVENYGGTIWVESEVGKGTTFKFTFKKDL